MCTLAIYFQMTDDYPVVIAANRDEYLDRPAAKPTTLCEHPHVVGGKDLRAGGTWLGVNEYGLVAGLLNRRIEAPPNPNARSRGLLCLDALRCRTAREAADFAAGQRAQDYNPFNLLIASRDATFVAYNRIERIEVVQSPARIPSAHQSRRERFRMPADQRLVWEVRRGSARMPASAAIRCCGAWNSGACSPITTRSSIRAPGGPTRFACISTAMGRARRAKFSSATTTTISSITSRPARPAVLPMSRADVPNQPEKSSVLK